MRKNSSYLNRIKMLDKDFLITRLIRLLHFTVTVTIFISIGQF